MIHDNGVRPNTPAIIRDRSQTPIMCVADNLKYTHHAPGAIPAIRPFRNVEWAELQVIRQRKGEVR